MTSYSYGLWSEDGEASVESDGRVVAHYSQTYLFKTDSMTRPTAAAISVAMNIFPGSPFAGDVTATAHSFKVGPGPEKTKPPNLAYLVTIGWSTRAPLPLVNSDDPASRRTIWSIRPQIHQRFITRYPAVSGTPLAGTLIVNTAGQPFDGGLPVDARIGTVVANRNVDATGYNKEAVLAYSGSINSASYLGAPAGTVQVDIEASEHYEGSYHFWQETYTFTYDPLGLQPTIASAGFYQRAAIGSNTLKRIQQDGEDVQEPEPLDSNGILVPIASRPASCAFVTVNYFPTKDFYDFGL